MSLSPPLHTESHSQLSSADELVRLVSAATDEDEAWGDPGAHLEDQGATGSREEGGGACPGSAQLSRRAWDRRDGLAATLTHQPLRADRAAGPSRPQNTPLNFVRNKAWPVNSAGVSPAAFNFLFKLFFFSPGAETRCPPASFWVFMPSRCVEN